MSQSISTNNPLIAQGRLNRVRGAVQVPSNTNLNITASYLGKAMISLALEGNATDYIETGTGAVTSPVPYMMATVRVNLLKTQGLAAAYKAQMEDDSTIGDITVIPDAATLPNYILENASIVNVADMSFAGESADWMVTLRGVYRINNAMWNLS